MWSNSLRYNNAPGETRTPNLLIRSHSTSSDARPQPQALTRLTRGSAWPEDATKRPYPARNSPLTFPRFRRCEKCPNTFRHEKHSRRFLCDICRPLHRLEQKRRANRAYLQRMPVNIRRAWFRRAQRMEKARFLRRRMAR